MDATHNNLRTLGLFVLVTILTTLAFGNRALAGAVVSSDEMVISLAGGGPILFDNFLPELGAAGSEPSLAFTGGPAPGPSPVPLAVLLATPGVGIVALTEPAGEVPDPGEVPIVIPGPNGSIVLSDLIVSTLNEQSGLPPLVALYSDGNPELQQITGLPPTAIVLPETGALQDLTALLSPAFFPGVGPITIQVVSDVNIPEPNSLALAALGFVGLAAWRLRRRKG